MDISSLMNSKDAPTKPRDPPFARPHAQHSTPPSVPQPYGLSGSPPSHSGARVDPYHASYAPQQTPIQSPSSHGSPTNSMYPVNAFGAAHRPSAQTLSQRPSSRYSSAQFSQSQMPQQQQMYPPQYVAMQPPHMASPRQESPMSRPVMSQSPHTVRDPGYSPLTPQGYGPPFLRHSSSMQSIQERQPSHREIQHHMPLVAATHSRGRPGESPASSGLGQTPVMQPQSATRTRHPSSPSVSPKSQVTSNSAQREHLRTMSTFSENQSRFTGSTPPTPQREFRTGLSQTPHQASPMSRPAKVMDLLLTATSDQAQPVQSESRHPSSDHVRIDEHTARAHSIKKQPQESPTNVRLESPVRRLSHSTATSESKMQPLIKADAPQKREQTDMATERPPTQSTKRAAEEIIESAPERKRQRQKYDRVPIWARLAKRNPKYDERLHGDHAFVDKKVNGQSSKIEDAGLHGEKARISHVLGGPWEMSIADMVPTDEMLQAVADFMFRGMLLHPELGAGDPRLGSLEIEAKLGQIVQPKTGDRIHLPVQSMTVLDQRFSHDVSFRSEMSPAQHSTMNEFLNAQTTASMQHHRIPIIPRHRQERDVFQTLNKTGIASLPHFPKSQVNPNHTLSLRTTYDIDPKLHKPSEYPVIARIVKRRLYDLDIYSPLTDYDLRISINIEVDIHGRQDIDPELIVLSADQEQKGKSDRYKDRVSYLHCANSIDLTQVRADPNGPPQTHELEIEVDAVTLRHQAMALKDGRPNAYEALVKGMLNDCILLMRVRGNRPGPGPGP